MLAFDAAVVGVAIRADHIAGLADAEQIGEAKIRAPVQIFVVEAGFKAGHDRSAGSHVVADLLALVVAKHGDIRQQERTVFAEAFGIEAVFVHEVESESAAEQRIVNALRRLVHVVRVSACRGTGIEKLRALSHDNADVCDGSASRQVGIVLCRPVEIIGADFLPAAVFAKTRSPSR